MVNNYHETGKFEIPEPIEEQTCFEQENLAIIQNKKNNGCTYSNRNTNLVFLILFMPLLIRRKHLQ